METALLEVATATNVTMSGLLAMLLYTTMKKDRVTDDRFNQTTQAMTEVTHSVQLLNSNMQHQNELMGKELEHINQRIDRIEEQ